MARFVSQEDRLGHRPKRRQLRAFGTLTKRRTFHKVVHNDPHIGEGFLSVQVVEFSFLLLPFVSAPISISSVKNNNIGEC